MQQVIIIATVGAIGTSMSAAAHSAAPGEAADGAQIERVIVTSERRATVLDATPAAVTALSGARLGEQGDSGLADLAMLSPNTSFTVSQGASQIFVRGIGNVFILAGGDPGVALYGDGAYVSDMTSANTALFDVQRVEILRGPQGALYGRNATGGAINILSARPGTDFLARASALVGGFGRYETEGFITGPVGEGGALFGRLSYQVKEMDGFTRNPLSGQVSGPVMADGPTTVAPRRLDDLSTRAARAQLQTDLGNANIRLVASHFRESDAGPSSQVLADPYSISNLLFGVQPTGNPRIIKSQGSSNRAEVNAAQAMLDVPFGSSSLSATVSSRHSKTDRAWDSDATEALVATTSFATASTDTSVDVHLSSEDASKLRWLVGATTLQFDQRQDIIVNTQVPLGFIVPGQPLDVPFPGGVGFMLGGKVRTQSTALYADLRYELDSQWALLGGLRVNHDRKLANEYQNIAAFGLNGTGSPSDSWTSTPGSVGVEYKPEQNLLLYGRFAHGFKSGAVNLGSLQGSLVKPEKVESVEFGAKADFMGRRGVVSASVFSSRYKDMQVSQVGKATVILANASAARIDGFELETQFRPIPALTLSAGLGLMNPEYTDFINVDLRNNPTEAVNVRGRQLAQVSRQQAALGAELAGTLDDLRYSLYADYTWRSRFYFTEFNTPDATQAAYGLLNLAATLRPVAGHWKLWANVRNAANTTAQTSMTIASPVVGSARQVTYTPPRQFGVGISIDFD